MSYLSTSPSSIGQFVQGVAIGTLLQDSGSSVLASNITTIFNVIVNGGSSYPSVNLTQINFPELITVTNIFSISLQSEITVLSAPVLETIGSNFVLDSDGLTSIDLSSLESIGGGITILGLNGMNIFSLPSLTHMGGMNINNNAITTVMDFGAVVGTIGATAIHDNAALTTISGLGGVVATSGNMVINNNVLLTSLNLDSLVSVVDSLSIISCAFSTLAFPSLTTLISMVITDNGSLTAINLGSANTCVNIEFSRNDLSQASVDDILAKIDGAGASNGSLNLSGGTNAIPSAAGLLSKTSLEGRGWTVIVNE